MPRYIIERDVGRLTPDEIRTAGLRSNRALASMSGVIWIKSYVSDAEGKIYCEYEAPDADTVLEHARRSGLPANRISEVSLEISPSMFV
jgi:hypothetical protein